MSCSAVIVGTSDYCHRPEGECCGPAFAEARRAVSPAFVKASADLMGRSFPQIVLKVLGENLNRSESAGRPPAVCCPASTPWDMEQRDSGEAPLVLARRTVPLSPCRDAGHEKRGAGEGLAVAIPHETGAWPPSAIIRLGLESLPRQRAR